MDKQTVGYTYDGHYSTLKRREILTHVTMRRNFEDTVLNELSRTQKDTYYINSTHMRYLEQSKLDRARKWKDAYGLTEGGWGVILNRHRGSVLPKMKRDPEVDGGDSCTAMQWS